MSEMAQEPVIILVRPQLGENIGAAARGMLNFGLRRLRLVDPRDGWPNPAAAAMASGAGRVLDAASIYPDVESALEGVSYVVATSARKRELVKPVIPPEGAMTELRSRIRAGQRPAILFGPERTGLENSELVYANSIVEVPVNPEFRSINLAQCVFLLAYEWMRSAAHSDTRSQSAPVPADAGEKSHFIHTLMQDLDRAGFFWPPEKSPGMRQNLKNLFMRMELSGPEVRTLHGVRRALQRRTPSGGSEAPAVMQADGGCGE